MCFRVYSNHITAVDWHPCLHPSVPAKRLPPPAFCHLPPGRNYHPYCSVASAPMLPICCKENRLGYLTSPVLTLYTGLIYIAWKKFGHVYVN